MKNSKLLILLFILLNNIIIQAQTIELAIWNDTDYGQPGEFQTPYISSDFGPRNYGVSRFHSGVDLTDDNGWGALIGSIDGGDVTHLDGKKNFKRIVIDGGQNGHTYTYTHIFDDKYPTQIYNSWLKDNARDQQGNTYPCVVYKYDEEYYALGTEIGVVVHGHFTRCY